MPARISTTESPHQDAGNEIPHIVPSDRPRHSAAGNAEGDKRDAIEDPLLTFEFLRAVQKVEICASS